MKSWNEENYVMCGMDVWKKNLIIIIELCMCMLLFRRVICDNGFCFMENCVIDYEIRFKNVFVDL